MIKDAKIKILENGKVEVVLTEKNDKDPAKTATILMEFSEFIIMQKRIEVFVVLYVNSTLFPSLKDGKNLVKEQLLLLLEGLKEEILIQKQTKTMIF